MISNFHTHTYLCHHAVGTPAEYVRVAEDSLCCSALGFSDHTPLPHNTWKEVRMTKEESSEYVCAVRDAGKHASFPVYLGFECEWHPSYASWYRDFILGELAADYLVFGPHWVDNGNQFDYIPEVSDFSQLKRYTDLTIQGIACGLFDFIAHPDLLMMGWRSWDATTQSCLRAILDAAIDCDMPLEINGLGLKRDLIQGDKGLRHPYPLSEFWIEAKEKGARVICNSDAHSPHDVISCAQNAVDFARNLGIEPIVTMR